MTHMQLNVVSIYVQIKLGLSSVLNKFNIFWISWEFIMNGAIVLLCGDMYDILFFNPFWISLDFIWIFTIIQNFKSIKHFALQILPFLLRSFQQAKAMVTVNQAELANSSSSGGGDSALFDQSGAAKKKAKPRKTWSVLC